MKVSRRNWEEAAASLDERGWAVLRDLLNSRECSATRRLYDQQGAFRKHVIMQQHGFGQGEYRYFAYPLPRLVEQLRINLYPPLAAIANRWNDSLGIDSRFPPRHEDYVARCHQAGQERPTPLLLRYERGDYNCLHQDLYGEEVFPLQVAILLSAPDRDFHGGELIITEQRPRRQSRATVIPLQQGDAVVFPVEHRPVQGKLRPYRATMRHGVSELRDGERLTLGIIFHDAS